MQTYTRTHVYTVSNRERKTRTKSNDSRCAQRITKAVRTKTRTWIRTSPASSSGERGDLKSNAFRISTCTGMNLTRHGITTVEESHQQERRQGYNIQGRTRKQRHLWCRGHLDDNSPLQTRPACTKEAKDHNFRMQGEDDDIKGIHGWTCRYTKVLEGENRSTKGEATEQPHASRHPTLADCHH